MDGSDDREDADDPDEVQDDRSDAEDGEDDEDGGTEEDLEAPYEYSGCKWRSEDTQKSEVAEEETVGRRYFAELGKTLQERAWFRHVGGTAWGQFGTRDIFKTSSTRSARLYKQWEDKLFKWMQFKRKHFSSTYTRQRKIGMRKAYDKLASTEDAEDLGDFDQWLLDQAVAGSEYQVGGPRRFSYSASLKTGGASGGSMTRAEHGPIWVELATDRWAEFVKRNDFYDSKFLLTNAPIVTVTLEESGHAAAIPPNGPVIDISGNEEQDDDEEEGDNEDSAGGAQERVQEEAMETETAEDGSLDRDLSMEEGDVGEYYTGPQVQQIPMTSTAFYMNEIDHMYKADTPELIKESLHARWQYDRSVHHEVKKISAMLSEIQSQEGVKAVYFRGNKKQSLDCQEIGDLGETGPCKSTSGVREWDNAHQSDGTIDCQLGSCHAMRPDRHRVVSSRSQLNQHHALQHAVIDPAYGGLQACGWCYYTSPSPLTLFLHLSAHVCQTALLAQTDINSDCIEVCGLLIDGEICGKPVGDFYLDHVEVGKIPGAT